MSKFKVGQVWKSRISGDFNVILTKNGTSDPGRPIEAFSLRDLEMDTFTVDGYLLNETIPMGYDLVTLIEDPETIREVLAKLGNLVKHLIERNLSWEG